MNFDWKTYWENYLPRMKQMKERYEQETADYQKKLDALAKMSTYEALKSQFEELSATSGGMSSGYQAAMRGLNLTAPTDSDFPNTTDNSLSLTGGFPNTGDNSLSLTGSFPNTGDDSLSLTEDTSDEEGKFKYSWEQNENQNEDDDFNKAPQTNISLENQELINQIARNTISPTSGNTMFSPTSGNTMFSPAAGNTMFSPAANTMPFGPTSENELSFNPTSGNTTTSRPITWTNSSQYAAAYPQQLSQTGTNEGLRNTFWQNLGRLMISRAEAAELKKNGQISGLNNSSAISPEWSIGQNESESHFSSLPNIPGVDLSKTNFAEIEQKYPTVWKKPSDEELATEYEQEKRKLRDKLIEFEADGKEYLYPYIDTKGVITFGYGHAVFDDDSFKSQPWGIYNGNKFVPETDPQKINEALNKLKEHRNSKDKNLSAESYKDITDLRLPREYIGKLLDNDIAEKERILKKRYKNWERLSPQIKVSLLELAFNVGTLAGWKNLGIAIEHMDELNNINYICGNLKRTENTQIDKYRNNWSLEKCKEGYLIPKDPID